MEEIIKIFSCSSDYVIITDHDFKILWSNRENDPFSTAGTNCAELFANEKLPLKSRNYELAINHAVILCKVINCPDVENGIYVFQTDNENILFSFLECKYINHYLENQTGAMRAAFAGITSNSKELEDIMHKNNIGFLQSERNIRRNYYLSYKMMRFSNILSGLIRLTNGSLENRVIDLGTMLEQFTENTNEAFYDMKMDLNASPVFVDLDSENDLFIRTDIEMLENCLISLVTLAVGNDRAYNNIKITASRRNDNISLTVIADSSGSDQDVTKFEKHLDLHNGIIYNSDMLFINKFCDIYGFRFMSMNKDSMGEIAFTIRFPCSPVDGVIPLSSVQTPCPKAPHSKYAIMYSATL